MRVLDIVPKEIVILTELSIAEIHSLIFCLERCEVKYDTSNSEETQHFKYFVEHFYKDLLAIKEKVANVS